MSLARFPSVSSSASSASVGSAVTRSAPSSPSLLTFSSDRTRDASVPRRKPKSPASRRRLLHGGIPHKSGWLTLRPASRFSRNCAVDRYAELAGPCIVFSACPNLDVDAACHQLYGATVTSDGPPSAHRINITTLAGDRFIMTAETPEETECWLRECTRVSARHISNHYACDKVVGHAGTLARTAAARDLATGRRVHVRHTKKAPLPPALVTLARREAVILLAFPPHPAVPAILDVYETPSTVYIVTDPPCPHPLPAVTIRDRVGVGRALPERDAAYAIHSLLDALRHLHASPSAVIHRGVTADSVFFAHPGRPSAGVRLTSFELAISAPDADADIVPVLDLIQHRGINEPIDSTIAAFIAPEVARGEPGGPAQDAWSAGILMHYVLVGVTPFHNGSDNPTAATALDVLQSAQGKPSFAGIMWHGISKEAKDLCARLLHADPDKRLLPRQALTHPWFRFNSVEDYQLTATSHRSLALRPA
jgi:hypothetical protein